MAPLKQFLLDYFNGLQSEISNEKELAESWDGGWQKLSLVQKKLVSKIFNKPLCWRDEFNTIVDLVEDLGSQVEPTTFVNQKTETLWILSISQEKLIIDVPNFQFQIYPISPTKFKPANTLIKLDIEFETDNKTQSLLMHLYAKGIKRASFEAF